MNKKRALLCCLAGASVALTAVAGGHKSQKKEEKKPLNILFIMCDDHSYQTISAYDSTYMRTPNIDRIAADGLIFRRAYVANSLSGPSRACLLTGKHSLTNGFTDNSTTFDGRQVTFPKLLQKAGYQTAMIGKWHLGSLPTGFNYWDILTGQGDYYNPTFICNGDTLQRHGYATNITTDLALDWLETKRDPSKPFCLLLHHKAPHRTWMPDTCDLELFDSVNFPIPETFYDNYEGRLAAKEQKMSIIKDMDIVYDLKMADKDSTIHTTSGLEAWGRNLYRQRMDPAQQAAWDRHYDGVIERFKAAHLTGKALAEWKYQQYMRDYCRVITSVDRNVGRVLDYLKEKGLLDNTLIVYTSDQGFYMGEHGWFDKRFMYEESYRTPLIMRMPGGAHGEVSQLVQNIDFAPTFLDVAGVKIPKAMQGESLYGFLTGYGPCSCDWRDALYYHYYEFPAEHHVCRHYGVSTSQYKLIHFYDDVDVWELYDLESDPHELHNIYGQPGTQEIVKELKEKLHALQHQYHEDKFIDK